VSKVAEILSLMAANAGQAALRRGAIIGGTVAQAADIPAQIYSDRQYQQNLDLHRAQVQQQMDLERSRGVREEAAATRQAGLDARANTAQNAADLKEQALKGIIGAGFAADPATFDLPTAVSKAKELGAEDLIPTVMAVHEKMQPKLTPNVDPTKNVIDPTGKVVVPAVAAPPKPPTAEEDKARYISLQARGAQNLPVLPAEQAWMDAYEKEKGLNIDKSAAAAAERAATATNAQTAQQKRSQDFASLQAARADLEKNVNTPYLTAKTSANTLRDVVDAAKSGNTVAGSLQSLEATMAAIRAQGLNRINTAEIGATANAGSLFQNIEGWLGKKVEGQPVPASVQKDMQDFADILEKAAYRKYQLGHKAVNDLYGTKIPEMLPGPDAPFAAAGPATPLTPGLTGLANRK
jgi:hypothetical protein